jgi:small-conductance mechanosensitive channel
MTVYDILLSVLVILVTIVLLRMLKSFFRRLERLNRIEHGAATSIYKILQYIVWVIIISIILQTFGIDITVLVAGSAALFVGLGFGLQNLFNDIASGLIILFERTLKVSDVVELDDGTVGQVVNIGLRVSEIKDRNNITVIVPNSKLVNEKVINWSHIEKITRFSIKVGVAYGSDVAKVQKLLTEAAKISPKVENTPPAFARFSNFGDSALEFELFFWTLDSFMVENIKSDIRIEINRLFNENEVVVAFPQLDVHLQS